MTDFMVQDGQTFVFQGDSITDCGRRDAQAPYGGGYVALFREMVTALFPRRRITYINKGIGGNTALDLKERWDDDTLRHQPHWLSVLVGINDMHRGLFDGNEAIKISLQCFRDNYDWLLERVKAETSAQVVLLEPFYISRTTSDTNRRVVLDLLPEYVQVVHDMSAKYDTLLVPMHKIYQQHLEQRDAEHFCPEPVHPNRAGHLIMALEMLRVLGGL